MDDHLSSRYLSETFRLRRGALGLKWNGLMSAVYRKNVSAWARAQFGAKSTRNQLWAWCDILLLFCKLGVIFIQTQCQKRKTRPKGEDWKSWRFVVSSIWSDGVIRCSIICIVFRSGRWAESISKTTRKVLNGCSAWHLIILVAL